MSRPNRDAQAEIFKHYAPIDKQIGLSVARKDLRRLFEEIGLFNEIHRTIFLTILDELGNNILRHSGSGVITLTGYRLASRKGIRIVAEDKGQGIGDLTKVLRPGYSQDNGMGLGLNLIESLADDVRIASLIHGGTRVEVWKWV